MRQASRPSQLERFLIDPCTKLESNAIPLDPNMEPISRDAFASAVGIVSSDLKMLEENGYTIRSCYVLSNNGSREFHYNYWDAIQLTIFLGAHAVSSSPIDAMNFAEAATENLASKLESEMEHHPIGLLSLIMIIESEISGETDAHLQLISQRKTDDVAAKIAIDILNTHARISRQEKCEEALENDELGLACINCDITSEQESLLPTS